MKKYDIVLKAPNVILKEIFKAIPSCSEPIFWKFSLGEGCPPNIICVISQLYKQVFKYIHTYIHIYMQTYIHTVHTYIHTYVRTDRQTDINTYIHTYRQTDIDTYIHTFQVLTAGLFCNLSQQPFGFVVDR